MRLYSQRTYDVSNAFRHSSVSGRAAGVLIDDKEYSVSNAFRHSSVSGPALCVGESVSRNWGLQCLSAFVRFGTDAAILLIHAELDVSPMPFGIRPFRDAMLDSGHDSPALCLQCLSAFVRFGTTSSWAQWMSVR